MDGICFDGITRDLAANSSRRGAVRALAASALAMGLSRLGLADVAAGCKQVGQKCAKDKECCRGLACKGKKCACGRGTQKCGKDCCGRGEKCLPGGDGAATCCPELKVCGKTCCPPDRVCVCQSPPPFDPAPDPDDLCRCICADGYVEDRNGNCVCPSPCGDDCCEKEDGEECCAVDGEKMCVLTQISKQHCGACGHACPKDRVCVGGKCVCPSDHLDCGDQCVPKRYPNGGHGCCGTQDCDGGAFCCTAQTAFTCDPHIACAPLNHCVACL
jgi:hypothetical protein